MHSIYSLVWQKSICGALWEWMCRFFSFLFLCTMCVLSLEGQIEERKNVTSSRDNHNDFCIWYNFSPIPFQHIILTFGHLSSLLTMRWAPSNWFKRRQRNFFFKCGVCSRRKEEVHKNTFFRHLAIIIIDNTHLVFIKFLRAKRKCWNIKLWLHCLLRSLSLSLTLLTLRFLLRVFFCERV